MRPPVPPEICDYIIDNLWDDEYALAACALTARSWVPASRFHLFRAITLDTWGAWRSFDRILQTPAPATSSSSNTTEASHDPDPDGFNISEWGGIAYYVRDLTLSCGIHFFMNRRTGMAHVQSSDVMQATFSRVLNRFQRVRHLKLNRMDWALSGQFRDAFRAISSKSPTSSSSTSSDTRQVCGIRTLTLSSLVFSSHHNFFLMLASYPHIIALNMDNIELMGHIDDIDLSPRTARFIASNHSDVQSARPSPEPLEILSIGSPNSAGWISIVDILCSSYSPHSLAHLRTIHLTFGQISESTSERDLSKLLGHVGSSLESLHIWPATKIKYRSHLPSLRLNPRLSTIHFHQVGTPVAADKRFPHDWLSQVLLSLTVDLFGLRSVTDAIPCIRKIILEPVINFRDNLDTHDWRSVRSSLGTLFEIFPNLSVEVWTGIKAGKKSERVNAIIQELDEAMKARVPRSTRIIYI